MFDALTRLATRRTRRVLLSAVVLFFAAAAFGGPLAGLLPAGDAFADPSAESSRASELYEDVTGGRAAPGVLILIDTPTGARSDDGLRRVRAVTRRALRDEGVARVVDLRDYDEQRARAEESGEEFRSADLVSEDGTKTYVAVFAKPDSDEADVGDRLTQAFYGQDDIMVGGPGPAGKAIGDTVASDLAAAEQIAFPILFVLMLFVFRGVVAALLPLIVGATTIVVTLSALRLVNAEIPLSIFALNLTVALGLGLAIDYSLFVVSRFREELDAGHPVDVAVRQTLHTAGKTVLFSAMTVAAALASLAIFPQQFLYSMAIAGTLTALIAAAVAAILLPAILAGLGHRVNALAPRRWQRRAAAPDDERRGFWYRLSWWVMRHAGVVTIAAAAVLLVVGSPFLRIQFTGIDTSVVPDGEVSKQVDTVLRTEFASATTEPISVVVTRTPQADEDQVEALADRIASLPGAEAVASPESYAVVDMWQFDVYPREGPLTDASLQLVEQIRGLEAPGPTYVAGQSARFVDQQAALARGLPIAIAIICGATLVILFLMTGSLLLPLKSLVMNFLGISAAFGILVLIFQDGRFEGLLDYTSQGGLESTQPLLLLALAFGLSTDYGVFLLTRIKEGRDHGLANDEAVALGIQRTGKIITAAAVLFCVAIGAFATSKIIFIKEVGVGTAAAVLIDATIVRALLVPSLMKLLGEWNWWAPGPLRRLYRRVGISEAAPDVPPARGAQPATPPASGGVAPPPRL